MTAERVKCSRATIIAAAAIECAAVPAVTPEMILQRDRRAAVSWLRARTIQRVYATGKYSTTGLGRAFGIDHSTVLYNLRRDTTGEPPKLLDPSLATFLRLYGRGPVKQASATPPASRVELPPTTLAPPPMARLMGRRA